MGRSRIGGRLLIGQIMAVVALFGYFNKSQVNPITGKTQRVSLTPQEEITLGLQSAPQMAAEFGGLYQDEQVQALVKKVGQGIVQNTEVKDGPYQFDFHVLADAETVNALSLIHISDGSVEAPQNRRPTGRRTWSRNRARGRPTFGAANGQARASRWIGRGGIGGFIRPQLP